MKPIQFDKDKRLHFAVGLAIGVGVFILNPYLAFITGCIVAIGKEVYDYFHPDTHTADVTDALVTIAGVALGIFGTSWFQL